MIYYVLPFYKKILFILFYFNMSKHTLSNKSRYSILKLSGFRSRMSTTQGRKTLRNRRKKGRKILAIRR